MIFWILLLLGACAGMALLVYVYLWVIAQTSAA